MYLFELLYQYIEENYLSASLGSNYEYLNFTKTATTLLMIVGGLCLGMMIACVAAYVQKKHIGKFIRTLLAEKAHDKQAAKSLAELGFDKNALIKHELSIPSATRKLIAVVEDDEVFTFLDEVGAAFPEYAERIKKEQAADVLKSEEGSEQEQKPATEAPVTATEAPVKKNKLKNFFFEKKFRVRKIDFEKAKFFIPESLRLRAEFRFKEKGNSLVGLIISLVLMVGLFFLALRFIPVLVNMLDVTIGNVMPK